MDTKEKIISISAELFHEFGYNAVGISKILEGANVPKGSFYYYFSSKENLLLEVIQYFTKETFDLFDQYPKTIQGLKGFFESYFMRFESLEFTRGCPLGNLALELADTNDKARYLLNDWTNQLSGKIREVLILQNQGQDRAERLSSFIVSTFEGVLLKAKIEKNPKPLDEFIYFIFTELLGIKED